MRKIKPRALGASARQPRARCEIDAAILTRIQAPFEGQSEGNPEQNGGEVLGGNGTKKRKHRRPRRGKKHPPAPRRARDRPRVGILSVAPAQPPAHRRYQRLFRRTIPASPPLDSPVSLLNRFLRNSSNICIMCSRFPRPPPSALARAHTLTYTHSQAHPRSPPPRGRPPPGRALRGPGPCPTVARSAHPLARSLTWSVAGPPSAGSRQPSGSAGAAFSCFQYMGRGAAGSAGTQRGEPRGEGPRPQREQRLKQELEESGGAGPAAPGPAPAPAPGPRAAPASLAAAAAASEEGPDKLGEAPAPSFSSSSPSW